MHEQAKSNERWWARYFKGNRHPSQGVEHPDLSGLWFTGEHKYRLWEQYSAEFRKAIEQHDRNRELYPGKLPFVCLTFHYGKGKKNRRFLVYEVKEPTFEQELVKLWRACQSIYERKRIVRDD